MRPSCDIRTAIARRSGCGVPSRPLLLHCQASYQAHMSGVFSASRLAGKTVLVVSNVHLRLVPRGSGSPSSLPLSLWLVATADGRVGRHRGRDCTHRTVPLALSLSVVSPLPTLTTDPRSVTLLPGDPLCPHRREPHLDGAPSTSPRPSRRTREARPQGRRDGQRGQLCHPHARRERPQRRQGTPRPHPRRAERH